MEKGLIYSNYLSRGSWHNERLDQKFWKLASSPGLGKMTYIGNKDTNLDRLFKILPLINPKFILQNNQVFSELFYL